MVIFPETSSGRMKLRWVNWLTNWIPSARSRLSNDITTVLALVWMSFLSTAGVLGGSVDCACGVTAGRPGGGTVCGAMVFLQGAARAGGGGAGGGGAASRGGGAAALRGTPRAGAPLPGAPGGVG